MPIVEISADNGEKESNSKEQELEHILSENMRFIVDSKDFDKNGPYVDVSPEDDDLLHIQQHKDFRANNKLRPQYEARLQQHEKKHQIQYNEKKRLGLLKDESKESYDTGGENSNETY